MPENPLPPQKTPVETTSPEAAKKASLVYYLILLCCFGNFLPYIITTSVSCGAARGFIKQEAFDHLVSVRDIKKRELENFFFERRADVYQLSNNLLFKWASEAYVNSFNLGGVEGKDYQDVDRRYSTILSSFCDAYQYYDVLLLDLDGDVVCSAKKRPVLGKNILNGIYTETPLAEAFVRGKTAITIGDMKWYAIYNGPAIFVSAPIIKEGERDPFGVLILHLDDTEINNMMTQRPGLKESGETYLVGSDLFMRSDSRFTTAASEVLKMKVDTVATREALSGQTNMKIIRDYRNIKVLSAYTPLEISSGVRWAIIAEIDKAEALALESGMIYRVVYMTVAMFPIWGAIIFVFHRMMKKNLF